MKRSRQLIVACIASLLSAGVAAADGRLAAGAGATSSASVTVSLHVHPRVRVLGFDSPLPTHVPGEGPARARGCLLPMLGAHYSVSTSGPAGLTRNDAERVPGSRRAPPTGSSADCAGDAVTLALQPGAEAGSSPVVLTVAAE